MKVTELNNLFVGYNKDENFRLLICAADEQEAQKAADSYCSDTNMSGSFRITEFDDPNMHFDCDYALTANDMRVS